MSNTSPSLPNEANGNCPECGGNGKIGMYWECCNTCDGTGTILATKTNTTEPTNDEKIRLKLLSLINNLQDVWLEDKDSWYGAETTVPEIQALISDQVAKAVEGALDQVGVFVLGGTVRLNDIYGNDYRNNYGYNETQVRDAANWIQDRQRVKLETLRATLNGVKK